MLVGTPVIAAKSGGNIEALAGGLGELVPPDDPEALAVAAAELANSPERVRIMTTKAQADARQRFGEDRHAARVSEIYDEIASRRRAPAAVLA
jgi:glycosyltransferase involved in cell wall biosynthesis